MPAISPRTGRLVHPSVLGWRGQWPMILGFVVLLVVAGISVWLTIDNRRQNALVAHTLEVETTASRFFIAVQGAESAQRGYLLALKPEYLERYRVNAAAVMPAFRDLTRLTSDNPSEQMRLRELRQPLDAKLNELDRTMMLAQTGYAEQAGEIMRTGYGRTLMLDIRAKVDALVTEEDRLLRERRSSAQVNTLTLLGVTLAGLALVVVLALLAFKSIARYSEAIASQRDDLRSLNDNLERLVAERTLDLTVANEEIQRYAYIVSHDLRAPLVNIMGFTSELEAVRGEIERFRRAVLAAAPDLDTKAAAEAIDTDLPESIEFIRASTQKMDRLINAILKISREGRRVLMPEPVDATVLARAAAQSVGHQVSEAGGEVAVSTLPVIVTDRLALEQIFGNLIENAVKYVRAGVAPEVRVTGSEQGPNLVYRFADNGRGIDPRDHERIFDLFRRAGQQDKPGEGIGLAHVRALVRRLGGNITVESAVGEGSTFVVTLPRQLKDEGSQP